MFFLLDIEKFKFFDDVYLLAVCICGKKRGEKKRVRKKRYDVYLLAVWVWKKKG